MTLQVERLGSSLLDSSKVNKSLKLTVDVSLRHVRFFLLFLFDVSRFGRRNNFPSAVSSARNLDSLEGLVIQYVYKYPPAFGLTHQHYFYSLNS